MGEKTTETPNPEACHHMQQQRTYCLMSSTTIVWRKTVIIQGCRERVTDLIDAWEWKGPKGNTKIIKIMIADNNPTMKKYTANNMQYNTHSQTTYTPCNNKHLPI